MKVKDDQWNEIVCAMHKALMDLHVDAISTLAFFTVSSCFVQALNAALDKVKAVIDTGRYHGSDEQRSQVTTLVTTQVTTLVTSVLNEWNNTHKALDAVLG